MFRRHNHIGGAKEGIRSGGEDTDTVGFRRIRERLHAALAGPVVERFGVAEIEIDFSAFAPADPVALHVLDGFGPVDQFEIVDQMLAIGGDPQHPLLQGQSNHWMVTDFGLTFLDFLVGQHGSQSRAPVDRHFSTIGEPMGIAISGRICAIGGDGQFADGATFADPFTTFGIGPDAFRVIPGVVNFEEDPLSPAIIVWIGGINFAVPVVGEAEGLDLAAKIIDVLLGGVAWVGAGLDGILFGRQSEGVPAHGVEDIMAEHSAISAEDVRSGIAFRVAHMETCA